MLHSDLLFTAENEIHVIKGISDCNNLSRTDNITCTETEESMELALCCNSIAPVSRTHLETTGCSKMSSVAGECSAAGLQEDGEKQGSEVPGFLPAMKIYTSIQAKKNEMEEQLIRSVYDLNLKLLR